MSQNVFWLSQGWFFSSFSMEHLTWLEAPSSPFHLELTFSSEEQRNYNESCDPVQVSSVAQSCPTLCDPMNRSMPGLPVHHQLPEFIQTHVHWHRWCYPTIPSSVDPFSSFLQSFPRSGSFQMSQLFALGGQNIGVSASTSILPMNTQISFRMDWLALLAVQGTLKSLLQHLSSKASILLCSAFFIVQLSHPYMTTGKTIALTRWHLHYSKC